MGARVIQRQDRPMNVMWKNTELIDVILGSTLQLIFKNLSLKFWWNVREECPQLPEKLSLFCLPNAIFSLCTQLKEQILTDLM